MFDEWTIDMSLGVFNFMGLLYFLFCCGWDFGVFDEGVMIKLMVSNFIICFYVCYVEVLRVFVFFGCLYLYFMSSFDEMVDKSLCALKYKCTDVVIVIGFCGGYYGYIIVVIRLLIDWGTNQDMEGFFGWLLVFYFGEDLEVCIMVLDEILVDYGLDGILGFYVEVVQGCMGVVMSFEVWVLLCVWRD